MLDLKKVKYSKKEILAYLCKAEGFLPSSLNAEQSRQMNLRVKSLWMQNLREFNLGKVEVMKNKTEMIPIQATAQVNQEAMPETISSPARFAKKTMTIKERIHHLYTKYLDRSDLTEKDRATLTRLYNYKFPSDKLVKVISYLESKCYKIAYTTLLDNPPSQLVRCAA